MAEAALGRSRDERWVRWSLGLEADRPDAGAGARLALAVGGPALAGTAAGWPVDATLVAFGAIERTLPRFAAGRSDP